MRQTRHQITENLAERLCWEVTRLDDARGPRLIPPAGGR
jgi:hypothetical protein